MTECHPIIHVQSRLVAHLRPAIWPYHGWRVTNSKYPQFVNRYTVSMVTVGILHLKQHSSAASTWLFKHFAIQIMAVYSVCVCDQLIDCFMNQYPVQTRNVWSNFSRFSAATPFVIQCSSLGRITDKRIFRLYESDGPARR